MQGLYHEIMIGAKVMVTNMRKKSLPLMKSHVKMFNKFLVVA